MTFGFIFILGFWSLFFLGPKNRTKFSYDADGNMLTDALATYTWNSDNRLVKVEKNINGCKHDKFRKGHGLGHLKHGKEAVVYEEYTYLPMDWRRVTRKAGKYSFKTDRKGNATKDDESEQTFVSIYDGEDESQEYLVTESKVKFLDKCKPRKAGLKLFREFVGGPAVDDIEHTRYNRLSLAMLKDGLGSTIALTGRDGKAIARIGYDAWGEFRWDGKDSHPPCKEDDFDGYLDRLENTRGFGRGEHNGWAFGRHFGSKLTPYLYTGRRFSAFTGQYNNRNRFYSPALGRFTTKDPIGFNGGMNLYRYADNNPMRWVDPYGLTTVAQILSAYFSRTNGKEGLWLMLADDEYTAKVRSWYKVQNLAMRAKSNLEYYCQDWKISHMTDSSWLPGMTDPPIYDSNAWTRWENTTTNPETTAQAYFNYLLSSTLGSNTIPESLWTDAIGQFGIAATVDDIDCTCHKATIRFWMFNSMDRDSFGKKNSANADLLGYLQPRQYMWWNWTEEYSW